LDFVQLTPEQRRAFAEDGFLVVPNALSQERVEALVEASDRLARSLLEKPPLTGRPEFNHLDLRPGLLKEEALFKLVDNSSTVPLVVQLMSPNIHLHSTTLLYKRPDDPNAPTFRRGWHRDIRIPRDLGHENLPMVGMKICYCLTDFHEPDSGLTVMARGSHRKQTPLELRKGEVDPVDVEVCDLKLNAGDAFIFENRIFHSATPNRSNRTAKTLMYGYSYRWMKPEVYLEVPDKALLAKADPVCRQLLGEYRDVDTQPWALERWAKKHGALRAQVPWTVEVEEVN
jgi:ectoine hydroxylase-related dioxygenase (phytanoyl-CoA dioxygenase family)